MSEPVQHPQEGTPIAFDDVRVGDVVRATMHRCGVEIAYAGTVSERNEYFISLGQKGCSVAKVSDWTYALLSRPPGWRRLDLANPALRPAPGQRVKIVRKDGTEVVGFLVVWAYSLISASHTLNVRTDAGVETTSGSDMVEMYEEVTP